MFSLRFCLSWRKDTTWAQHPPGSLPTPTSKLWKKWLPGVKKSHLEPNCYNNTTKVEVQIKVKGFWILAMLEVGKSVTPTQNRLAWTSPALWFWLKFCTLPLLKICWDFRDARILEKKPVFQVFQVSLCLPGPCSVCRTKTSTVCFFTT